MNFRAQIVSGIKTLLQGINGTGGYLTSINTVEVWCSYKEIASSATKWLNIRDVKDEMGLLSTKGGGTLQDHTLTVEIDCFTTITGTEDALELRKMIADVYKAIGVDYKLGFSPSTVPTVIQCNAVSDEILVNQEELKSTGAVVTLSVDYRTNKWEN